MQHGSQATQVHFHSGNLCGRVGFQDEVSRGFALLGVSAGDTEMDTAILLQQPPAQRQPHAAAIGYGVRYNAGGQGRAEGGPGQAKPVPARPTPRCYGSSTTWCPPLTCWHQSPAPLAPSRLLVARPSAGPPRFKCCPPVTPRLASPFPPIGTRQGGGASTRGGVMVGRAEGGGPRLDTPPYDP